MTIDRQALREQLSAGVQQLCLDLPDACQEQLLDYLALLQKWNSVYNLTAVRDAQQMLTHHLLDCLAALHAFVGAKRVLDVGSGGGLPGVIIAIWAAWSAPEMRVELIDTVHKKTAFLTQAKAELQLRNLTVHTGRVEQLASEHLFDVITSRAFAALNDFVNLSGHLLCVGGKMIAMKGPAFESELTALPPAWRMQSTEKLIVPAMSGERYLITLMRTHETSN
jgi:16S rRNA (guanine527-N7)-methyltransferase